MNTASIPSSTILRMVIVKHKLTQLIKSPIDPDENRTQALKRNNKRTTTYTRKKKNSKKTQGWQYSPEYEKARRQKQGW